MHIKKLHEVEEALATLLEEQLDHLACVNAAEMGEVVDMMKDIAQCKYYSAAAKAMTSGHEVMNEDTIEMICDAREGKSHKCRKTYLEAKESHSEKSVQMRELEKYMQELSSDIIEMLEGASSEERAYLSKKIAALAAKIQGTAE